MADDILTLLGEDGPSLLKHCCQTIPASILQLPGPDFVDRIFLPSDRNARVVANLIKQKLPETNGGFRALKFGQTSDLVYSQLTSDHPIDLCRYQVANCYLGRIGLINSGGASGKTFQGDLSQAVRTAVINKRAGGTGLISGRKAFQHPMPEGVRLLNVIQDVYLDPQITIA